MLSQFIFPIILFFIIISLVFRNCYKNKVAINQLQVDINLLFSGSKIINYHSQGDAGEWHFKVDFYIFKNDSNRILLTEKGSWVNCTTIIMSFKGDIVNTENKNFKYYKPIFYCINQKNQLQIYYKDIPQTSNYGVLYIETYNDAILKLIASNISESTYTPRDTLLF